MAILRCVLVFIFLISGIATRLQAEIVAPDKIDLGKLLRVSTPDDADLFFWSVPDGIDYEASIDNKKLVCTGLAGTYKFQLTSFRIDWDNHKVTPLPQSMKIVVIGEAKPPTPPVPPPIPLVGTAKEVYEWGMSVAVNRDLANRLSVNYKTIATKYNNMEVTVAQALEELRILNNKVLDTRDKKDAWSVFGSRLEEKMNNAWPMEKTVLVKMLEDISLGLSYVK